MDDPKRLTWSSIRFSIPCDLEVFCWNFLNSYDPKSFLSCVGTQARPSAKILLETINTCHIQESMLLRVSCCFTCGYKKGRWNVNNPKIIITMVIFEEIYCLFTNCFPDAYSKFCQTSKMELFEKIVNSF